MSTLRRVQVEAHETDGLWQRLIEFPTKTGSPLILKASVPPSQVTPLVELILAADLHCSLQSHAGNGIVIARFAEYSSATIAKVLIGSLQPSAQRLGGHLTVLRAENAAELTHQAAWGSRGDAAMLMGAVRCAFDPHGLLNPGRI